MQATCIGVRKSGSAFLSAAIGVVLGAAALWAAGCDGSSSSSSGTGGASGAAASHTEAAAPKPTVKDRYVIGMVAKSSTNPVYLAARAGAEAAAQEIGKDKGVQIEIVWRSPTEEDAARQYELIGELVGAKVDGIAVSCSDPALATPAIDTAMAAGVQVVTFDADAPQSDRVAFYGIDDGEAGATVFRELAAAMGEGGRVAILAGNRAAENIRSRVVGAGMELRQHPGMEIVGVFHHDETPEAANAAMIEAQTKHGPIDGWALVGGWPLYSPQGLDGVPDSVKIVSMDPLPPALDYAAAGRVSKFVAQPYFGWGYESVRTLMNLLHDGKKPDLVVRHAPLEVIDPSDADAYRARWVGWVGTSAINNGG
ncbi:MAG: substrate-binding domain-containing protein [Phycisphaeraceae bacterium]|nr:MAG: substrate-binding domain-containing protein [Phycisphaeraceae bacterium]